MTMLDRVLNGYRHTDPTQLEIEELRRENVHLNARILRMGAELAQKRLEVERLRRTVKRQRPTYSWLAERAELDAKGLYALQLSGVQPSRRNAKQTLNMGERRWAWARALAMLAGVHDGALFYDLEERELLNRLREAAQFAAEQPEVWRQYKSK